MAPVRRGRHASSARVGGTPTSAVSPRAVSSDGPIMMPVNTPTPTNSMAAMVVITMTSCSASSLWVGEATRSTMPPAAIPKG